MKTTDLFVELVIIGFGFLGWLLILLFIFFDISFLEILSHVNFFSSIPILIFVYVIGILFDRATDTIFRCFWGDNLRFCHFKDCNDFYNAYYNINIHAPIFLEKLEYSRSRIRILRSWFLHFIAIGVTGLIFIWLRLNNSSPQIKLSIVLAFFSVLFSFLTWLCWRRLEYNYCLKIKHQAKIIKQENRFLNK